MCMENANFGEMNFWVEARALGVGLNSFVNEKNCRSLIIRLYIHVINIES